LRSDDLLVEGCYFPPKSRTAKRVPAMIPFRQAHGVRKTFPLPPFAREESDSFFPASEEMVYGESRLTPPPTSMRGEIFSKEKDEIRPPYSVFGLFRDLSFFSSVFKKSRSRTLNLFYCA